MNFYNAEQQFNENFKIFCNPQSQPEKYNLYAGLGNLAKGLQYLEEEIRIIKQKLENIKSELKRR